MVVLISVRRAMGKKIKEEMDRLKGEFADGAVEKNFTRAYAEELFDLIVKFAGYGFNKSSFSRLCFGYFLYFISKMLLQS